MATYRIGSESVTAVQVREPKFVETRDGPVYAKYPMWVILRSNGDVHVLENAVFQQKAKKEEPPGNPR